MDGVEEEVDKDGDNKVGDGEVGVEEEEEVDGEEEVAHGEEVEIVVEIVVVEVGKDGVGDQEVEEAEMVGIKIHSLKEVK